MFAEASSDSTVSHFAAAGAAFASTHKLSFSHHFSIFAADYTAASGSAQWRHG
jgi:hypothetical protein